MHIKIPSISKNTAITAGLLLLTSNVIAEKLEISDAPINLDSVVVTASGSASSIAKAPASISIVNAEQIKQQPVKDIVDVLKTLPGVSNHVSQGSRNGIVIRGLDEDYVLRLVNGTRISSGTGIWRRNNFDNTPIPLAIIDQVEVVRGPMSALYGSDAMGGVVNIITRTPTEEWLNNIDVEHSVMQQGKGGNRSRISYVGSGKLNEDLSLTFSAEQSEQDAWNYKPVGKLKSKKPDYTIIEPRKANKFSTALDWNVAENQTLTFNLAHDDDKVLLSDYGNYQRSQHIQRWSYGINHKAEWQWGGSEITLSQSDAKMEDFNTRYIDSPTTTRNEQYLKPQEIYTTARAVNYFDLGDHSITAGLEHLKTEIKDDIQYPIKGSDSLSLASIFLQDEARISNNLTATIGVRAEDAQIYGFHVSPRAYLVYDLGDGITLKGGVGSAFRAPTLFEASTNFQSVSCGGKCTMYGNPDLKEETSVSSEISLLVNRNKWNSEFTLYNNDVDELIEVGRYAKDHERFGHVAYFNIDEATLRGVETNLQVAVTDMMSIGANYTYLEAEDSNGNKLAYRPEHKANLRFDLAINDSISAYLGANYYGDYIHYQKVKGSKEPALHKQKSYTIVDLGMSFQATQGLALRTGVTNIGNTLPIKDDPLSDLHLQGRAVFAAAEYNF